MTIILYLDTYNETLYMSANKICIAKSIYFLFPAKSEILYNCLVSKQVDYVSTYTYCKYNVVSYIFLLAPIMWSYKIRYFIAAEARIEYSSGNPVLKFPPMQWMQLKGSFLQNWSPLHNRSSLR